MSEDKTKTPSHHLKTIVVPVSRPDTAKAMLQLATSLIDPEEGVVLALVCATEGSEQAHKATDQMRELIQYFVDEGHNIEPVTELAISVSRGILDVARERGADLIMMGVHKADRRRVKLGTVVENVIQAAPCDVLIYRISQSPSFNRIIVPVDGTTQSVAAMQLGILMATQHEAPLRQLNIQYHYRYNPDEEELLREALAILPNTHPFDKRIVVGTNPEYRVLSEVGDNDLLILGFALRSDFERRISDDFSNKLLNRAPGAVILIARRDWHNTVRGEIERRLNRIKPTLTEVEQDELVWGAQKSAEPNIDYSVMIVLSAGLASLGLLINSVAVIIGAMLVAPLMSPISAVSIGMGAGFAPLARRAVVTLIQGVILALLIAIFFGVILPIAQPTTEMLARGNPSLLDAGVALVSGLVAAYATARKGIPAALAGVAIAAALMPPICTVGLGIAFRDANLALGAGLLFLTNIIFIVFAQYAVLLWLGLRPQIEEGARNLTRLWWVIIGGMVVTVVILFLNLNASAFDEASVEERLAEAFAPAEIIEMDVVSRDPLDVNVLLRSEDPITPAQVLDAEVALSGAMDNRVVNLQVVTMPLVRAYRGDELIVRDYLETTWEAEVLDLRLNAGEDVLSIQATITSERTILGDDLTTIQNDLETALEQSINLTIEVQQVSTFAITTGPTLEPEATDEPDE